MENSRKIVRVNVEVVYDDGTLEEFKEVRRDRVLLVNGEKRNKAHLWAFGAAYDHGMIELERK